MADSPDGSRLLALARKALRDELLAAAQPEQRYILLMIGNAMAIAARELAQAEAGDRPPPMDPLLAGAIRSGALDGDAETYHALLADVVARLTVSNPKAIGG
jgi:hypothetical protein